MLLYLFLQAIINDIWKIHSNWGGEIGLFLH